MALILSASLIMMALLSATIACCSKNGFYFFSSLSFTFIIFSPLILTYSIVFDFPVNVPNFWSSPPIVERDGIRYLRQTSNIDIPPRSIFELFVILKTFCNLFECTLHREFLAASLAGYLLCIAISGIDILNYKKRRLSFWDSLLFVWSI